MSEIVIFKQSEIDEVTRILKKKRKTPIDMIKYLIFKKRLQSVFENGKTFIVEQ
jgi:hypothetical protein